MFSEKFFRGGGTTTGVKVIDAHGIILELDDGSSIIDCTSQSWVYNLGFDKEFIDSCLTSFSALPHVHGGIDTDTRDKLVGKVLEILPESLTACTFSVGGALGVEAAMKLAILTTGNSGFVSLFDAYHGTSFGTVNAGWATSLSRGTYTAAEPFSQVGPKFTKIPNQYCFRCPLERNRTECDVACARWLETTINKAVQGKLAGVILEPIQGSAGQIVHDTEFLTRIREICDKYGVLLIFDEIQTFCRIGEYTAATLHGVEPDILILSKGFGGGLPISCIAVSDKITRFTGDLEDFHTFNNSQIAQHFAISHLDAIKSKNVLENTRRQGERIFYALKKPNIPMIGDIRQVGLHVGIELVSPGINKKAMSRKGIAQIKDRLKKSGLLVGQGGANHNVLKVKPPLIINDQQSAQITEIIIDVLEKSKDIS